MEYIALKNICKINMGQSPDSSSYNDNKDGIPFFQGNADFGEKYPVTRVWCNAPIKVAQPNDILISVRAPIGALNFAKEECCIGRGLAALTPDRSKVSLEFIYWVLKWKKAELNSKGTGSTFKAISRKVLEETLVPAIDFEKQYEYVEILGKTYSVIKKYKKELNCLDGLIKARFVELFECGDHEIVKASDVCDFITKGTTPPTGEITEEYENGKIPFLKVYNLSFTGEMLFDENPQYILAETHNGKLARSKVYPNDVLMNIVGPPLGKFTLVTDEFEEWNINQAIAIFRAKERILPRFLLHALMQPKVLEPFIGQAVGIRQQNLSLEQCRNLQFPLPSLEEQKSFVEFAEQLDKSKVAVQKALDETQMLFDSLMQEYFN